MIVVNLPILNETAIKIWRDSTIYKSEKHTYLKNEKALDFRRPVLIRTSIIFTNFHELSQWAENVY